MNDVKELIKALRCSSEPGNYEDARCRKCPYVLIDKLNLPGIGNSGEWVSCDCDRICRDAADMLESMEG